MKQRVVILSFHGFGHINACLKLGRILQEANYEVFFAGAGYFRQYTLSQNFPYYLLKSVPFGLGLETWVNKIEKKKHPYLSSLLDRVTDRLYKKRKSDLFWMLEELKPHTVLIDSFQATDFIVMHSLLKSQGIKVAIVHTTIPLYKVPGRPPMNSDAFPHEKEAFNTAVLNIKWNHFKNKLKKKITSFGFGDKFIIRRRLRKNRIPREYVSKAPALLNFVVREVDEFIIVPLEFDFLGSNVTPLQHYLGFMLNVHRTDQGDREYANQATEIFNLKRDKKLKLIYCSFGTVELKRKATITSFLERLIQATLGENFLLLISLKSQPEDISKLKVSENVYIFRSVPQLEVLNHTDLFITHGGINSIKEAIHAEVPMLMYPIHVEYDAKGNSARVVHHKLGLRGNVILDTEAEIKEKIKELLSNPVYKKNVIELKRKDAFYTPERFLEKFKKIKPLSV